MGELKPDQPQANVNVTLDPLWAGFPELFGKEFPCFLCGTGLSILVSKTRKPYFICNSCGIQSFVRGKEGISRLRTMANDGILVSSREESAAHGIVLLNRLEQLKLQKRELEQKRDFIFSNPDIENAIEIVDAEIKTVQGELAKMALVKQKEINK
jgi:hypothetical protein